MRIVLMTLLLVTFFFISTHASNSMCVYNQSEVDEVCVHLDCGYACDSNWGLINEPSCSQSGQTAKPFSKCYGCRYDTLGIVTVTTIVDTNLQGTEGITGCPSKCPKPTKKNQMGAGCCQTVVQSHGWVEITSTPVSFKCPEGEEDALCNELICTPKS